jgi:esterase/lipase superfamily enzyme
MFEFSPMAKIASILFASIGLYGWCWYLTRRMPRRRKILARSGLSFAPLISLLLLYLAQLEQQTASAPPPVAAQSTERTAASPPVGGDGPGKLAEAREAASSVVPSPGTSRAVTPPLAPSPTLPAPVAAAPWATPVPLPPPVPTAPALPTPPVAAEPRSAPAPSSSTPAAPTFPTPPVAGAPRGATSSEAVEGDWDVVPVFYGTDRSRRDEPQRIGYGSKRAKHLELGRALITVPKLHQVPIIERPWAIKVPFLQIAIYQQSEDPKLHFTIKEMASLSREDFTRLVRERLAASRAFKNHAMVFVHGYNTSFDYALFRMAQMAYDLKFDGAPFLYSWPSGGGLTSYGYDRESSIQAEPYLKHFLDIVVKETGAQHISIVAHSMGNLPLLQVLREIKSILPRGVRLEELILAAPDVDRDVFENLARNLRRVSQGVTLYASANDRAMEVSRRVAGGVPRAGDVPADGPVIVAGIDTIDVTATSTEFLALNHSIYAEKAALLNDIGLLLQTGERPPERRIPILERVATPRGDYWRYPEAK